METLSGNAMPAQFNGANWDHTYVESDDGQKWGCFGRDSGGRLLASAKGDSAFANCLSFQRRLASGLVVAPGYSIYADIIYGVTGVCHQAANRILHPAAGIDVASANGYRQSLFLYTRFGAIGGIPLQVPWSQLSHCSKLHPQAPSGNTSQVGMPTMKDPKAAALSRKLDTVYQDRQIGLNHPVAREELRAMADVYLGEGYDKDKIESVARLQQAMQQSHKELASALESGQINAGIYVDRLRQLLLDTASKC
jgi:hypothetical protein